MSILLETARILHIESTDVCQAECPLCERETDHTFDKNGRNSLSVQDIKRILPEKIIYRLDKMFMCGNYGDPAANSDSLSIFSHFREVNSSIVLGMNTNGGLQNQYWWADMANVLYKQEDYVVFSIDGLEDTNHIYRKNVSWDRVMHNAETFIKAGGNAHWDMLVYEHNEHQVDACEQLALSMGFKTFRAKVSKRNSTISWLKPPKQWYNTPLEYDKINCKALQDKTIYLDARGNLHPCCWMGHEKTETLTKFNDIQASWDTETCNPTCKKICGNSGYVNQWQKETNFN